MALGVTRHLGWIVTSALLLAGNFDKIARAADRPAVSIGDVVVAPEASDGEPTAELGRSLRRALSEELGRTDVGPIRRPFVLSATLSRLSSERRDANAKATAVISVSIRHADDQVLCAELRGRATVEQADESLSALRRAALTGAVRGALGQLGEVVRRAP
jgi:hypothetical protein